VPGTVFDAPQVIAPPELSAPKPIEATLRARGLVALHPLELHPPLREPEPERNAEARDLITISRQRRALTQAVADYATDVAIQRKVINVAAQLFGAPEFDGSDKPEVAMRVATEKLNNLLESQRESEAALADHVAAFPTEAEMQARITALRQQEAAEAKAASRSSYSQHMRRSAEIFAELQTELAAAYQVIKAAKSGHFRTPANAAYFAEFFTTACHPGNGDNALAWSRKLEGYLTRDGPGEPLALPTRSGVGDFLGVD
jgi:hypothetical protein